MSVVKSFTCPEPMFEAMEEIVKAGLYPSRNSVVTAGIKRIIDEVKAEKTATQVKGVK